MDRILRDSAGSQQDCMLDSLPLVYQNVQTGRVMYHLTSEHFYVVVE